MPWEHGKSRQSRGYGARWDKLRLRILARDSHLCQPCLNTGILKPATQVDHITPKAKGGTDDPDNLQAICDPCHKDKTAREAAEAQGRTVKKRIAFDAQGRPVW
jgi:5-methylcytosine-specific restriction enzyme A